MDNLAEQFEEIEALKSIYENSFNLETGSNVYSMKINQDVKLYVTLNDNYPSSAAPKFELLAPKFTKEQREQISNEFEEIYKTNLGSPILFQWIEKLKDMVECCKENEGIVTKQVISDTSPCKLLKDESYSEEIIHGEIIQDRKSVFQGHASKVQSVEDTKAFINHLLLNKKISQATHNILAYRILTPKGTILQDCDDDGETHAGGRVLHLLQILNLTNVMVVVSRWYGGIHLGPDRFKHINNAARQVLVQGGFLPS